MKLQNNETGPVSGKNICAARIHKYGSSLVVENIRKPSVSSPEEVLLRVGAAGLCHSDLHLINGDWQKNLPISLPKIPGHEIAGWIEEIGSSERKYEKGRFSGSFWRLGLWLLRPL